MLKRHLLNLQLFGEGGEGGDGGSAAPAGEGQVQDSGENKIPASIPEKAKKYYQKAMEKTAVTTAANTPKVPDTADTTGEPKTTERIPYADLIKSDDYKDEHKAYMDKAIGDRLKKYKGIEENLGKHKELLEVVARKYGVNPEDENFLQVLGERVEADDPYYEQYAVDHNMSVDDARKIVAMERKVAQAEEREKTLEKQEQMRQHIMLLRQNAEKTKARFPQFDLETEMQNENFRRLCAASNGDTTAAYMACHWNEVIPATVQMASKQIQAQTAQAVASNQARPIENGISSTAPSVVEQDFKNWDLQQIRDYAEQQRRKLAGR